jgi:hypothetical protein
MSLVATLMQDLRSRYTNTYDKYEQRGSRYGALRLFQQEARENAIFDEETINNIMNSYNRDVVVPVLDEQAVPTTSGYTRTCAVIDNENDSALVTLTFLTYGAGFSMVPSRNLENDIKYQQDFERKLLKIARRHAADLDEQCVNTLIANRNQVWTGIDPAFYAALADYLQVPQADKNDFYNNVEGIMNTMDFFDGARIVANHVHMPLVRRLDNQGSNNAENEAFQFEGIGSSGDGKNLRPYTFFPTNRMPVDVGGQAPGTVQSSGFIVNAGSVGLFGRNDPDARANRVIGNGQKEWSVQFVPEVEEDMAFFYQEDCADNAGTTGFDDGLQRSVKEGFEVSKDYVFATAYNSNPAALYGPIVGFEVLS